MNITGGKYNGRKIIAPDENITRPTLSKVRMGVFNTLFSILGSFEGKNFLDVFGGSGIMGLEALSRDFCETLVIEKNKKSADLIKKNYKTLGLDVNLIIGDSLKIIPTLDKTFDVIYIDPPYKSGMYEPIFKQLKTVVKQGSIIVVEGLDDINFDTKFEQIKLKKYGDKVVSFFQQNCSK